MKLIPKILAVAALAFGLLSTHTAMAQAPIPVKSAFAEQYNLWSINSYAANSYTFPQSNCYSTPLTGDVSSSYFVFGNPTTPTYWPVFIQDANPAISEIVTPTALSTVSGACGFSASTVNSHTSFVVKSGTAGLQDAVGALGLNAQLTTPVVVYLDRNWYSAIAALPGSPTAASIIAALKGSVGVNIVDTTTSPFNEYAWNGTQYVVNGSPAYTPFLHVTSYTQVAAPTALASSAVTAGLITTATTGGTIPASGVYRLAATYVDASGGETLISTDTSSTITAGATATNTISVTSPIAATGAVGWRLYMTAAAGAAGTEILYTPTCSTSFSAPLQTTLVSGTVCPIGATATITAVVTGTAKVPAVGSAWPRTAGAAGSFPPFAVGGALSSTTTGTLAVINLPAGYLNTLGRSFTLCGNGYAVTNATPGTLAFASTIASVPGVTTTSVFSAASGTTTASATVPFNFCVAYTVAAVGTTGTLWAHGTVTYGLAGTAVGTVAQDTTVAVSGSINFTTQDQLAFTLTPTTTATTSEQLTQLQLFSSN